MAPSNTNALLLSRSDVNLFPEYILQSLVRFADEKQKFKSRVLIFDQLILHIVS